MRTVNKMSETTCGVGIVGMDHWYIAFMALEELGPQTKYPVVAVADHESWRLDAICDKCSCLRTTEFDRVLEHPNIGLIVSMVNSAENPDICRKALLNGKHVLSVKPPAMNPDDLDRIIYTANEQGRWFGSFESYRRLLGRYIRAREILLSGRIGSLVTYHQTTHAGLPQSWSGKQDSGWWLDPEKVCGGAWIDHGIYGTDMARWLFGEQVSSISATMTVRRFKDLPFEDYGVAILEFPCGGTAVLEDSWVAVDFAGSEWIIGTHGSIRIDGQAFGNNPVVITFSEKEEIVAQDEEKSFVNLCKGLFEENSLPFGPEDSRENLAVCLAAYRSAEERVAVGL